MSNDDFKITTIKQRKEMAKKEPLINHSTLAAYT